MRNLVYPDYENCILNVTGSILKHYGAPHGVPSLPSLDVELAKGYRNVVLWLVDAMGSSTLERLANRGSALIRDKRCDITSVFPSTTVSATTAVLSGKYPMETGWLGWCQYFEEEKRNVILFTNEDYYEQTVVIDHPVAQAVLPYQTIYRQIEEAAPDVQTAEIFPAFRTPEHDTVLKEIQAVEKRLGESGRHFIYAYWDKLDTIQHEFGPSSPETLAMLELVEEGYRHLIEHAGDDTLILVIADHGQVDVRPLPLWSDKELWDTFRHAPSVESRATAFFVKEAEKKTFERRFRDLFRTSYVLIPAEEVLQTGLFGPAKPHPRFWEFLGDYLAIAVDDAYFQLMNFPVAMKGQHAGLVKEEMLVPLIVHAPKR